MKEVLTLEEMIGLGINERAKLKDMPFIDVLRVQGGVIYLFNTMNGYQTSQFIPFKNRMILGGPR